jgi:NDP-sugar pyrophosphorylase family protein
MMNVVIPMAGEGSRFKQTHDVPKPLIDIKGKPMIVHAIESLGIKGKYHFIVRDNEFLQHTIDSILSVCDDPNIVTVTETTSGSATSALLLENMIDTNDELIIANCDQIMNWQSDAALEILRYYDGAVVTYNDNDPKHSYAKVVNGFVEEIREKTVISNHALTGIHYWAHAGYFFDSARRMIQQGDRTNNEFYVGPTYNYLIRDGLDIGVCNIGKAHFFPVGTPQDLERYLNESR